jgi:hypothetical protein
LTGPLTVFPVAWTAPMSCGGRQSVLPVIVNGPLTVLLLNSTPPLFAGQADRSADAVARRAPSRGRVG